MTSELLPDGGIRIAFAEDETGLMELAFLQLVAAYTLKTEGRPSQAYWDGMISKTKPDQENGLDEAQEMLQEARAELKSERAALAKTWLSQFQAANRAPFILELKPAERDELVAMINDRRLIVAMEAELSEGDIEGENENLSPFKQAAVREIEMFGNLIMAIIGPSLLQE